GAPSALIVLGFDYHATARRDYGRADRHGDIHGIAPLGTGVAVAPTGALGHAEGTAPPGQRVGDRLGLGAGIAQGIAQPVLIVRGAGTGRGQGQQADFATGRQHPAHRFGRYAENVSGLGNFQLERHGGVELVLDNESVAPRMLARGYIDLTIDVLDHVVVEMEYLRPFDALVGIGHYAIGIGVFVDGRAEHSWAGEQQGEAQ